MDLILKLVKFRVCYEAAYSVFIDYLLAHVAIWYETVFFLPAYEALAEFFYKFVESFKSFFPERAKVVSVDKS